ncbi:hypothetical protein [Streptomyces jumonjinensis]|uniref:hypothetical protein n=1 Tax=Streptomyces jumonjinensis TaxID=1945 RepID=UPI0037BAC041
MKTGRATPDATTIFERKDIGHPDTLTDHLAERLSRAYSRYPIECWVLYCTTTSTSSTYTSFSKRRSPLQ